MPRKRAPASATQHTPTIRDRISGLLRLPKTRLTPNPRNWRLHPEQQRKVLRAILGDVGVVDTLLARPEDEKALKDLRALPKGDDQAFKRWARKYKGSFVLIDGHLRLEEIPGPTVPVLVLDLDANEEAEVLATLDPIASLAETDKDMLADLTSSLVGPSDEVSDLLAELTGQKESSGQGGSIEVVDTTKLEEEFYLSVRGPLPQQPRALDELRKALEKLPGVIVETGLVG